MHRMVGLSRAIKQEWLDKAGELVTYTSDEGKIKDMLDEYLSYEIKSPTNLRKSRDILMNIWVRPVGPASQIRDEAIRVFNEVHSNKTALHWGLMLHAYPIFADVCGLIGKITMVQDTFTTAWLQEKVLSQWGERQTLIHAIPKILQTLRSLGAVENMNPGVYQICTQRVSDSETIKIMLMALLALKKKAYYEVSELSSVPLYFPFEYSVPLECLNQMPEFNIDSLGGKMVVQVK